MVLEVVLEKVVGQEAMMEGEEEAVVVAAVAACIQLLVREVMVSVAMMAVAVAAAEVLVAVMVVVVDSLLQGREATVVVAKRVVAEVVEVREGHEEEPAAEHMGEAMGVEVMAGT